MTTLEDFKKPINIIFLLGTVIGILLSIYFYRESVKSKSISYELIEPASLIYDSNNASSSIKLLDKDSSAIKDNVYILTGVIWNSGDIPINVSDVRKKITLHLTSAKKIIDFKILKQRDSEIAKFKLTKASSNSLDLNWNYFDPDFGFSFQIIYTGKENPDFSISGKILDIHEFKKGSYSQSNLAEILVTIFMALCSLILGFITGNFRKQIKVNKAGKAALKKATIIVIILCVVGMLGSILMIRRIRENPNNPFLENKYFNKKTKNNWLFDPLDNLLYIK